MAAKILKGQSKQSEPTPTRYLEHARAINTLAGEALHIQSRKKIPSIRAKVAMGLSFQAAELAGKGMLRAFGLTTKQITQAHRQHDLLKLYDDIEQRIRNDQRLVEFRRFLLRTPVIDDQPYSSTTRKYLKGHFAHGPGALPGSYFYPDTEEWTGPVPIHALYFMVQEIIAAADRVITTLEQKPAG